MAVTFADAARLEQLILSFLVTRKAKKGDADFYRLMVQSLENDRPTRGQSVAELAANLRLPPSLTERFGQGRDKLDSTRITTAFRAIKDRLRERETGDPGRFIRRDGAGDERTSRAASEWTGLQSRTERLIAIRQLVPLAQAAIETMIATLETPSGNGGPPLDERDEALGYLRELHHALGEILVSIDGGGFDDELGEGLCAEAARYAARAADALRDDPMPYAVSALVLGVLTTCGFPGAGAFLSATALTITKRSRRK